MIRKKQQNISHVRMMYNLRKPADGDILMRLPPLSSFIVKITALGGPVEIALLSNFNYWNYLEQEEMTLQKFSLNLGHM